ncbi:MAG: LysR family transcriptional regulator [Rubrivivax sp.]
MPRPPAKTAAASPSARAAVPAPPQWRFRARITAGELIAIGPGKIALLEAIERTGSITAAAKSLDMSYRRAWVLLDEVNRSLRLPAVDSAKGGSAGGGSVLTEAGRELVTLYRRIEQTAAAACKADIRRIMGMLAR